MFTVFIALVATFGSIAVEGFAHDHHHRQHIGRYEYHKHHHNHPHYHDISHEYPQPGSHEYESAESSSSELDGSSSELHHHNSFEPSFEESWHNSQHHRCRGWRCKFHSSNKPYQITTTTQKPITTSDSRPCKEDETRKTTSSAFETTAFDPSSIQSDTTTSSPTMTAHTNDWHITKPSSTIIFIPDSSITGKTQGDVTSAAQYPSTTTIPSVEPTRSYRQTTKPETTAPNMEIKPDNSSSSKILSVSTNSIPSSQVPATAEFKKCMSRCSFNPSANFVCGTDRVTYFNIERLNCAIQCGQDVQVLCNTSCAACYKTVETKLTKTTTTNTTTTTTPKIERKSTLSLVEQCRQSCRISSELNPVCGSNGVTYDNPGLLLCTQLCEKDVKIVLFSSCPPVRPTTTESAIDIANCQRNCPVTSEHNPVCGTNGLTYDNPGRLECAKYCGVNVELRAKMACLLLNKKDFISSTTPSSTITSSTLLSKATTASSISQSLDKSSTLTTLIPPMSSSSTTNPAPNFTISEDLLTDIFGTNTKTSTQANILSSTDNYEPELDVRFDRTTEMIPAVID